MPFRPGPGVGGHCIPVDPYYLSWRARAFDFTDRFIELAGDINLGMPRHVVELVGEALNDRGRPINGAQRRRHRRGVQAQRAGRAERRRRRRSSPASRSRGADVVYHDPHVPSFRDADGVIREGVELAACSVGRT